MGSEGIKATKRRGRLWLFLRLLDAAIFLGVIGFAAFTLILLFARWHWVLDNATSFESVYFLVSIPLVAAAAVRRMRVTVALAGAIAVYHMMLVLPFYYGAAPDAYEALKGFRIMSANLQWDSKDPERVYRVIEQEQPHVLALQEVTPARLPDLERLRDAYPYWTHYVDTNLLGVALLSKFPLEERHKWITKGVYSTVIAKVEINEKTLHVVLTHTVPPFSADWVKERDAQLAKIQQELKGISGSCLVAGDLNASMWTPAYLDFVRAAGLENARRGYGIVPTYKLRGIAIVPIDHVLCSGDLIVRNCRSGPEMGSDHLPLVVDIVFGGDAGDIIHIADDQATP